MIRVKVIYVNLFTILLIIVFTLPRTIQLVKIAILGILVFLYLINTKKIKVDYIKRTIVYSSFFLIPLLNGLLLKNETNLILGSIATNILYPMIFLLLLQAISKNDILDILYKSSKISIITIFVIGISTLLFGLNIIPFNLNSIFYPRETFVGIHEGYIHIVNSSLSYLIFLIPIYFYDFKKYTIKTPQLYFFVILLIFCIVTGRRILALPFVLVLILNFKYLYRYVFILIFVFIIANLNIKDENNYLDLTVIIERFDEAIHSKGNSEVRLEQSDYFHKYISKKPFFGYGLGSYMKDYIRSPKFKTAYERTYDYQLFSLGLIVSIFLLLFYVFCFRKTYLSNINNKVLLNGFILGTVSLIIASYTNPYWLSNFDYCLPLALLIRFSQKDLDLQT